MGGKIVDRLTKEQRSFCMSQIKSRDTKPELRLRKALRESGLVGYKLNSKLPGKPDIVFAREKVVIFVDGDFWHGNDFKKIWERIKDKPYWARKIPGNMQRDNNNNTLLKRQGWAVIRLWESDVNKRIGMCIKKIKKVIGK